MGVVASRQFKKALQSGDENAVLRLYHNNEELRSMDPSRRYGLVHKTTPLHYATRKRFKQLFREFMINGGSPNAENYLKQSIVHEICTSNRGTESTVDADHCDMLLFLINFCTNPAATCPEVRGKTLRPQLLNLNKQDSSLNTPLHLAAISGLRLCVKVLLDVGAVVSWANIAGQTPLDCAGEAHHDAVVAMLEAKVVFAPNPHDISALKKIPDCLRQESYQGMREQELQDVKDALVIETSSILGTNLSDTAALLHAYGWSKALLVEAWLTDSAAVCKKAKVKVPMARQLSLAAGEGATRQLSVEERECGICSETIVDVVPVPCGHSFCRNCWAEYLQIKIGEGKVVQLHCPSMDCEQIVPFELVSLIVGPSLSAKYLKFGIDAFVKGSEDIRWCPYPGCGRAVRLTTAETTASGGPDGGDAGKSSAIPRTVDCGGGHFFCWSCSTEAHDPCDCELWTQWKLKLAQEDPSGVMNSFLAAAGASSDSWVAENTKPCPKCRSPIQKNEGCNHMSCSRCSHQFCWVCLGSWTFHGSRTGGYFQCNKYKAARSAERKLEKAKEAVQREATEERKAYFKHVYSRFENHTNSLRLEERLLAAAKGKAVSLVEAATEGAAAACYRGSINATFFEDAVRELLKSRQTLRASYAMGYFIVDNTARKELVKLIAPLEKVTEILAEMVSRPYLRTSKETIILTTAESRDTRRKCLIAVRKLNPTKQESESDTAAERRAHRRTRSDSSFSSSSSTSNDEEEGTPSPTVQPPVNRHYQSQTSLTSLGLLFGDDVPPPPPPSPPPPPPILQSGVDFRWYLPRHMRQ